MALEFKQKLSLGLQQKMTPQLQYAIKLLQMNRMELVDEITTAMTENPVLEELSESMEGDSEPSDDRELGESAEGEHDLDRPESEDIGSSDSSVNSDETGFIQAQSSSSVTETATPTNDDGDFNWESYVDEFSSNTMTTGSSMREDSDDLPSFENVLTKTTSLEEHIAWQFSMEQLTPEEQKLGELIIGNLGDDGYLRASLEDLAKESEMQLEDAEEILKMIQRFDPIGVASRDLKECLLVQAQFLNPRQELVEKIISEHLGDLEKKNYGVVAKALGLPQEKIIEATRLIMEFEPKPGRSFASNDTHYITPDIYIYKVGTEYVINLNEDGMPKLRISPYYKSVLAKAKAEKERGVKSETKDYVQDKLRSAVWLIRSIQNRQRTIFKVADAIVKRQREFFEKGVQFLKPMILKDVASDIGMHESTVSRVTTNKFAHTPIGIFELKYFFNSSIQSSDGFDTLASEAVKQKIRNLVSKEDPKNPLSDQKIVELLQKDNVDIARRTVAKYREMLGVLSSSKRKKII